jgi:thiamine-monophosphate kinase
MEFDLIERIRARATRRDGVVLGIGDDAALLQPPPGMQLAVATDTLNAGVHFPDGTAPADIGWKALAVNLSDLAAMGARPAWCTLSLSLPDAAAAWVDAFLDGFLALADREGVALVGGDTTRGPLSICVTAHGLVAPGRALRRDGARAGDDVWVTGTLGDAAAALALWRQNGDVPPALRQRLDRPQPRVEAGRALAGIAHACIDVSDGVLADLGHVCRASAVSARVEVDALPSSPALLALQPDDDRRRRWQASGGDDYELCFTAPVVAREAVVAALADAACAATRIGGIEPADDGGATVRAVDGEGGAWQPVQPGYRHFVS